MEPITLEHETLALDAFSQRITEVEHLLEVLQGHQSTADTIIAWAPSVSASLVTLFAEGVFYFPALWMAILLGTSITLMIPLGPFIYCNA